MLMLKAIAAWPEAWNAQIHKIHLALTSSLPHSSILLRTDAKQKKNTKRNYGAKAIVLSSLLLLSQSLGFFFLFCLEVATNFELFESRFIALISAYLCSKNFADKRLWECFKHTLCTIKYAKHIYEFPLSAIDTPFLSLSWRQSLSENFQNYYFLYLACSRKD